jgi:hypothetical protein
MGGLIQLAIMVLYIVGTFKTFQKMGYDDAWWAIIPFLNFFFFAKVLDKSMVWGLLFFIPLVNLVLLFMVCDKVSKAFGKGIGYALGLLFLGWIFYPILGFGASQPQTAAN